MIEYGLTEGQKQAPELGYVPLPQPVVQKVAAAADAISPDYKIAGVLLAIRLRLVLVNRQITLTNFQVRRHAFHKHKQNR